MSRIVLESSNQRLVKGFDWAKQQALKYVYSGDPVGDWYEAALPGREAFCMRDVSHQSTGAQVLGLGCHNRNMLGKFAYNISESKDFCSYWEINKHNLPAPVDYTNDQNFWYNLPANFDVLDCCYRQYLWTGDRSYLTSSVFLNFYDRTVTDYVDSWDINGDGLLEHLSKYGFRGLASYNEENWEILVGADLVAAQYAGYLAYANIQELRGKDSLSKEYMAKAKRLSIAFDENWWNENAQGYYAAVLQDHSYWGIDNLAPLYFGIVEDRRKTNLALDNLVKQKPHHVEGKSHLPETFYKYGRNDAAYEALLELADPGLERREYPEVSYSMLGSVATGMMGISPDARCSMISTVPRLIDEKEWVKIQNVPVLENEISVCHRGNSETTFTNQSGVVVHWKACFRTKKRELLLDGSLTKAIQETGTDFQKYSYVTVPVERGETHTLKVP